MVIVARPSRFIVFGVALLLVPTVFRAAMDPSLVNFAWALLAVPVVIRTALLTVAVDREWVVVRNFFSTTAIPLWEAEVELGEPEGGGLVSDLGGPIDQGGRSLYVKRSWHEDDRVLVTVAPRYGHENERVYNELCKEIAHQRTLQRV